MIFLIGGSTSTGGNGQLAVDLLHLLHHCRYGVTRLFPNNPDHSPACGTALFAVFYFPTEVPSTVSWSTKLKRVDYFGIFLGSAGLVCFILGISLGNNPYPWKSGTPSIL